MAFFKILPLEITLDIINRIPIKSVLDCKFVCTTWNNFLRHPSFSKTPFQHLILPSDSAADSGKSGFLASTCSYKYLWYFEYDENRDQSTPPLDRITRVKLTLPFDNVELLGSCNGLIFLSTKSYKEGAPLCICNPVTREYVLLPEIKNTGYEWLCYWTSGFGYVSSTNEYKVVRMMLKSSLYHVYIYSLGSGHGWKNLGIFSFGSSKYCYAGAGSFANGALHWLDKRRDMIVVLDLAEEKFREHLSLPPSPTNDRSLNSIGVVDGYLYFAMYVCVEKTAHYDIWLLKKKNDNHDMKERQELQSFLWSKEFRIRKTERLIAFIKSTNGVLAYNYNFLNICDTKTSTSKKLVEYEELFWRVSPHKHTLVSLKDLGEQDTKIMEFVEETENHDQTFNQVLDD